MPLVTPQLSNILLNSTLFIVDVLRFFPVTLGYITLSRTQQGLHSVINRGRSF